MWLQIRIESESLSGGRGTPGEPVTDGETERFLDLF
jgi:hypothetical protein